MADRLTFAADTGGTFTDLVVNSAGGAARLYKRPTTPSDPVIGLLDTLGAAAADMGSTVTDLLERSDLFVFGTTLATNAIVTSSTARTALLVTEGHPDILLLREGGGRRTLFDYSQEYPEPYIPRALTFEIRERLSAAGEALTALDEQQALDVIARLREAGSRSRRCMPDMVDDQTTNTRPVSANCSRVNCRTCRIPCPAASTLPCASTGAPHPQP